MENKKKDVTVSAPAIAWPFPNPKAKSNKAAKKTKKTAKVQQPTEGNDTGDSIIVTRSPTWVRDELILALDLYLANRTAPPNKQSAEVLELSNVLNKMGRTLGLQGKPSYRNTNGVYMKMMNFRSLDPEFTGEGKVGLTRGGKDETTVWAEFANDPARLAATVSAIKAAVEQHFEDRLLSGHDEPEIHEAEEGRILTRMHRVRERSRALVELCKREAIKRHGKLVCEACGFNFVEKYGVIGEGMIDVHHTRPLYTLTEGAKTQVTDLALLCSNCHRVVHSSRKWLTIEQVRDAIAGLA